MLHINQYSSHTIQDLIFLSQPGELNCIGLKKAFTEQSCGTLGTVVLGIVSNTLFQEQHCE